MQEMIELGSKVRDVVTTLEGIVTSRTEYLNGCRRYCVQPQVLKDGKSVDPDWVDSQQLKVLEKPKDLKVATSETWRPGGPGATPTPFATPPQ